MPTIYNQVYQVPVWIAVNLRLGDDTQAPKLLAIRKYLTDNGATNQPWPANTFGDTVQKLTSKGWAHAVKPLPYILDSHFATVAAAEHVKVCFGPSKVLNLGNTKPWHHVIDRKINIPEDYTRIFDGILMMQDHVTLSHLFDIGDRCHNANVRSHVFFTEGTPPINLLRAIASNVIVVGDDGDVAVRDLSPEDAVQALDKVLETAIRP